MPERLPIDRDTVKDSTFTIKITIRFIVSAPQLLSLNKLLTAESSHLLLPSDPICCGVQLAFAISVLQPHPAGILAHHCICDIPYRPGRSEK